MKCDDIQRRLFEIPVDSFVELEPHFEGCAECRAMADEIRAGEDAVGRYLDDFAVSTSIDDAWAVAELESAEPANRPFYRLPAWTLHGGVAALAAAAVLAVTVWPQGREALQERATEVARAVWNEPVFEPAPEPEQSVVQQSEPKSAVVAPVDKPLPRVPESKPLPFEPPEPQDTGTPMAADAADDVVVVPPPMPSCDDLLSFESGALKGELAHEDVACLQTRLVMSDRLTQKDHISRILMKNAWSKGDRHAWARRARYHLDEIDQSDPDLAYKYALHLGRQGANRAWATIYYSELALENRAMWSGDTHVKRVYGIYKLRALAAQGLWNAAEDQHDIERSESSRMKRDDMRTMTKVYALEWLEYADAAGKDLTVAQQLCGAAAETEDYCNVSGRR